MLTSSSLDEKTTGCMHSLDIDTSSYNEKNKKTSLINRTIIGILNHTLSFQTKKELRDYLNSNIKYKFNLDVERSNWLTHATDDIWRYTKSEKRTPIPIPKDASVSIFGEPYRVVAHAIFENPNANAIEIVRYKYKLPQSQEKFSAELYALAEYAHQLYPDKDITASFYYLEPNSSKLQIIQDYYAPQLKGLVNSLQLNDTTVAVAQNKFVELKKKRESHQCSPSECANCGKRVTCQFVVPQKVSESPKQPVPLSDITLSAEQDAIINANDKYACVVAGAGAGKTLTLALKVATMIASGIDPHKIVCLTYMDAAANELKERIILYLGEMGITNCSVDDIRVSTFHTFAKEIIDDNYQMLGYTEAPTPEDITCFELAREAINTFPRFLYNKKSQRDFDKFVADNGSKIDDVTLEIIKDHFETLKNQNDSRVVKQLSADLKKYPELAEELSNTLSIYYYSIVSDWNYDSPDYMPPYASISSKGVGCIFSAKDLFSCIKKQQIVRGDIADPKQAMSYFKPDSRTDGHRYSAKDLDIIFMMYDEYQKLLKQNNIVEFDDFFVNLKQLYDLAPDIFDKYDIQHIIVDEYQDTPKLQEDVLRLFFDTPAFVNGGTYTAIGDDDQTIMQFNGGSAKMVSEFDKRFPQAKMYTITENHRCSEKIIETSNKFATNLAHRYHKKIVGTRPNGNTPEVQGYYDEEQLTDAICDKILTYVAESNTRLCDIAILCRNSSEFKKYEAALSKRGIASIKMSPAPYLDDTLVQIAVQLSEYYSSGATEGIYSLLFRETDGKIANKSEFEINNLINEKINDIEKAKINNYQKSFMDLLQSLDPNKEDECYQDFLTKTKSKRSMEELLTFFVGYKTFGRTEKYHKRGKYDGVCLTTMHSAKGLEWKNVIIDTTKLNIADDDRLLYVGMTRAKDNLFLTGTYGKNIKSDTSYTTRTSFSKNRALERMYSIVGKQWDFNYNEYIRNEMIKKELAHQQKLALSTYVQPTSELYKKLQANIEKSIMRNYELDNPSSEPVVLNATAHQPKKTFAPKTIKTNSLAPSRLTKIDSTSATKAIQSNHNALTHNAISVTSSAEPQTAPDWKKLFMDKYMLDPERLQQTSMQYFIDSEDKEYFRRIEEQYEKKYALSFGRCSNRKIYDDGTTAINESHLIGLQNFDRMVANPTIVLNDKKQTQVDLFSLFRDCNIYYEKNNKYSSSLRVSYQNEVYYLPIKSISEELIKELIANRNRYDKQRKQLQSKLDKAVV